MSVDRSHERWQMSGATRVRLAAIAVSAVISGCTVIKSQENSTVDAWYLGLVGLETNSSAPTTDQATEVRKIRTAGTWIHGGIGLGFRSSTEIRVPPHCQVVVLIENEVEAERILNILSQISEEGNVCAY